MNEILEIGLFPLAKRGFQKFGRFIGSIFSFIGQLLFGRQMEMRGKSVNGTLYVASSIVSTIGTLALALMSFYGSFTAASDFAKMNGIDGAVAMFIPVTVDGLIFLCVAAILTASFGGYGAFGLTLIVMSFTALSIYFNISHMPESTPIIDKFLLGGTFPSVVVLASEITSWQIKKAVAYVQSVKTYKELVESVAKLKSEWMQAESGIETMSDQAQALQGQIKAYQTTVSNLEIDLAILAVSANANEANDETIARRVQIIRIKAADPKITQAQLAELLETSQKTISRDVSDLTAIIASPNGKTNKSK